MAQRFVFLFEIPAIHDPSTTASRTIGSIPFNLNGLLVPSGQYRAVLDPGACRVTIENYGADRLGIEQWNAIQFGGDGERALLALLLRKVCEAKPAPIEHEHYVTMVLGPLSL